MRLFSQLKWQKQFFPRGDPIICPGEAAAQAALAAGAEQTEVRICLVLFSRFGDVNLMVFEVVTWKQCYLVIDEYVLLV